MSFVDNQLRDRVYLEYEDKMQGADRLRMYRHLGKVASTLSEVTPPDLVLMDLRLRSFEPAFMAIGVRFLLEDVDKLLEEAYRGDTTDPWTFWQTKVQNLLYSEACWNFVHFEHRRRHGPDYFEAWRDLGRYLVDYIYSADWWDAV